MEKVTVLGAGLAGSECAWQIAARRYQQTMKEIKRIEGIIAQQRRWNL